MESTGSNELNAGNPTHDQPSKRHLADTGQPEVSMSVFIERTVRQYFKVLGDEQPSNLYEVMLHQLEKPLLTVVLEQTRGNQTRTAEILGLNRGTLRKKLKTHHLM